MQTSTALRDLDRDSLIRTLNQLRDALNTAEEEKVQLQAVLRSAKCSIDAFAALKREHKELQSAHMDQTRLLQRMQGRISKTEVYRNTIEAQEGVITRMQSVIEARIQQNRAQAAGKNTALPLPKPPRDELDSARSKRNSSEPTAELPSSCEKDTVYKSAYLALEGELREASEQVEGLTDRVSIRCVLKLVGSISRLIPWFFARRCGSSRNSWSWRAMLRMTRTSATATAATRRRTVMRKKRMAERRRARRCPGSATSKTQTGRSTSWRPK